MASAPKKKYFKMKRKLGQMKPEEKLDYPKKLVVPPKPTIPKDDDVFLHNAQQEARIEQVMLRGVRSPHRIMEILGIKSRMTVCKGINRVKARWEMMGSNKDFTVHRGEALSKLDHIEDVLWAKVDDKLSAGMTVEIMRAVLKVNEQRLEILGLTPKVIANIGEIDADTARLSQDMQAQERVSMIAARMFQMIEDRKKQPQLIEHEPQPPQED